MPNEQTMRSRPIPDPWYSYRRRNRIAAAVFVAVVPLVALLAVVASFLPEALSGLFSFGVLVLWCAALGYAAIRVVRWPCPRCGKPWLTHQDFRFGAPRKCSNCGLGLHEAP